MVTGGICARISSEPDGTRLGVEHQVADCEALAARFGVADRYTDNDISARSGKVHPEYERMVDDLKKTRRSMPCWWGTPTA